ncbi:HCN4, partial [Symbiodinium sp. KB8]
DSEGNTVTDNCAIAQHYARGWLPVDIISIFPFDLLASSNDDPLGKLSLLRALRLLRLFKLLRILRASRIINRWRNRFGISNAATSLVRFLVMFLLIMHWGACLWFMAATLSADPDSTNFAGTWVEDASLGTSTTASKYMASIYFAASTSSTVSVELGAQRQTKRAKQHATGCCRLSCSCSRCRAAPRRRLAAMLVKVGYGDISAVNDTERGVALLVMLMGGGLYAFMVGSVQTIIASIDEARQQFDADSDNLNLFMASVSLPQALRIDIREFFDQTLQVHRERYYRDILRKLSPMLRKQVAAHCHMAWVTGVPFLACKDQEEVTEFAASIAVRMRSEAFAPFEIILRPGHINRRLFIIQRGLAVRRGGGRVIGAGHWFGEEMILTRGRVLHEGISSITLTLCMTLHRDDLAAVLESGHFERTRRTLRRAVVRLALRQEFVRCARLAQLHARRAKLKAATRAIGRMSVLTKAKMPFSQLRGSASSGSRPDVAGGSQGGPSSVAADGKGVPKGRRAAGPTPAVTPSGVSGQWAAEGSLRMVEPGHGSRMDSGEPTGQVVTLTSAEVVTMDEDDGDGDGAPGHRQPAGGGHQAPRAAAGSAYARPPTSPKGKVLERTDATSARPGAKGFAPSSSFSHTDSPPRPQMARLVTMDSEEDVDVTERAAGRHPTGEAFKSTSALEGDFGDTKDAASGRASRQKLSPRAVAGAAGPQEAALGSSLARAS